MAERVYRKKANVTTGVTLPAEGAPLPAAPQSNSLSVPTVGGQTTQRVYKKKATTPTLSGEVGQTAQRTYSIRPEVKAQKLQTWIDNVTSLSEDATDYFDAINEGAVPSADAYNQMATRLDTAIAEVSQHRQTYANVAEVTDYIDQVAAYLNDARRVVERYRGGLQGALQEEMAQRVQNGTKQSVENHIKNGLQKQSAPKATITAMPENPVLITTPEMALDALREKNANAIKDDPTIISNAKAVGSSVLVGLAQAGHTLYQGLDWLLPDEAVSELFGVENRVGQFFDDRDRDMANVISWKDRVSAGATDGYKILGDRVIAPTVTALPNLFVAAMSGGATAAASLGTSGGSAFINAVSSLAKNPSFWMSFVQSGGSAYSSAKESGANEMEAQAVAWLTAFPSAVVEIGGGIEKIPQTSGGVLSFVRNAVEEGGEEVLQGIIEQAARTIVFEHENQWLDLMNENSVISIPRATQEFIGGVTVGAVLGAGTSAVRYAYQSYQYFQLGEYFVSGENGVTIDDAIRIGLNNAKGTDAYKAAVKIGQAVQEGGTVSAYTVGRMVAESQTEQAQRSRAIEREVLESAAQVGYDTAAAETVSLAAVALNQRVRFAAEGELGNSNNAGEYHRDTDTVLLNPALTDTDMLIGTIFAHEMTHTAEGTKQLATLAKIAQRMEGKDGWESLKAEVKADYAATNQTLDDVAVESEALASWIGENLFNKRFAQAVADGDANTGNAFLYLIDRVRRAFVKQQNNPSARNIAMLERLFMQALDARTIGPKEGDVQGAFMDTDSGMANDSLLPYDAEMRNLIEQRGDFVVDSYDKLVEIVNLAFDKPQTKATAYFGIVDAKSLEKIKNSIPNLPVEYRQDGKLFKENRTYSIAATLDSIRHLVDDKKSLTRADVIDYLDRLADTILEFDTVNYSAYTDSRGNKVPGIRFKKTFDDGTIVSFNTVSQGKRSLTVQTLFMEKAGYEKRKSAKTPLMQNAPAHTPEVRVGQTSNTNVAQKAPGVNTQSMQEGAGVFAEDGGNSAQGALLPPEYRPGARAEGVAPNANVEGAEVTPSADGYTSSVAYGDTFPSRGRLGGVEGARPYGVDGVEGLQEGVTPSEDGYTSSTAVQRSPFPSRGRQNAADAAVDTIIEQLGEEEALRRMWNATQMDRPTGMVDIDGKRVDVNAYMDAYEQSLPRDKAALERHIAHLQEQRAAEVVKMEQEGTLEDYHFGGLKLDLQLFAATRLWDLLQLDEGETGKNARQFYEKRLRGTDANHNQELVDLLAGRSETYNPIATEKTLEKAKNKLRDTKYKEKLIKRIGRYDSKDLFNAQEVAAAMVLINDAINDGEIGVAADLITGLSRKGTELGRAVQSFSIMARLTPEGTLRAAIRTVKADADSAICEGANEGLDVLADDIARAIQEAAGNGLSSEEIADRIRRGVVGRDAPVQFDRVPQGLANQVQTAIGTDVTGYALVADAAAMKAIIDGGASVETLIDAEGRTLYIVTGGSADIDTTTDIIPQRKRIEAKLSREELVQLLSENLAAEQGNFLSQEEIYDLLWKTVEECSNIPEQVKRYVLKKIRKDDGGLAQRIYELYLRGDLKQVRLRRAMESALELPTLTDDDLTWLAQQGAKIESLQDKPVEQADAMEELYDFLGAKLTVSGLDRLQSWRKFGMLFNVKTHLRNVFSNWAYSYVRKADDAMAMAIERLFVRDRSKWGTALGWSHTEHGQSILPQLQEQATLAVLEMQKKGAKYEGTGNSVIKQRRKFFGLSKFGEMLNGLNRWNSEWLEREDVWFFKPAYIDALGQAMTARGVTEITPELHSLAMQRALEATFRADNAISDVISSLKQFQNESATGKRLFGHAVDVVIPFHKTPANIATQIVMHSPVGIVKGAFDIHNATVGKGSKDMATAINTMAKGITGSALLAIGILLGTLGAFNAGFGKTEKERAADEMAGLQEGAFVINGVSVSLDWLQPAASPLVVGASIGERMKEEGISLSGVFGAVMDGTDSLFELTMLQSLYDILGGYDAGASGTLMSVGENVVSQSVPTLVGQVARSIDPTQRKTKGDNDFETILNQVVAKIPGLTYLLDPELDVWGNEVYRTGKPSTGTAVLNAAQQVVIPANTKVGTGLGDPISEEILRLYEEQGGAVIPTAITRDEAKDAGEDYVDVNKLLGGVNRLAVEALINNQVAYDLQVETGELTEKGNPKTKKVTKYYRDMTDDERRKVLSRIYSNTKDGVIGDASEKTEEQLTDSERYVRDLLRRVRNGEQGTSVAAEAAPEQQQEDTSYYEDLLRRMRNGN